MVVQKLIDGQRWAISLKLLNFNIILIRLQRTPILITCRHNTFYRFYPVAILHEVLIVLKRT
jgi:hypothetical protein